MDQIFKQEGVRLVMRNIKVRIAYLLYIFYIRRNWFWT